jgi:hypothetical protein
MAVLKRHRRAVHHHFQILLRPDAERLDRDENELGAIWQQRIGAPRQLGSWRGRP